MSFLFLVIARVAIGDDCAKEFIKNRIVTGSDEFFDPSPKTILRHSVF